MGFWKSGVEWHKFSRYNDDDDDECVDRNELIETVLFTNAVVFRAISQQRLSFFFFC